MKNIKVAFEHDGKKINLTATMDDYYGTLSSTSINNGIEFYDEGDRWSMYFPCNGTYDYELRGGYADDSMYLDYIAPWNKEKEEYEEDISDIVDNFPCQYV